MEVRPTMVFLDVYTTKTISTIVDAEGINPATPVYTTKTISTIVDVYSVLYY